MIKHWSAAPQFVHALAAVRMPNVFNPYRDICSAHDLAKAPAIRRRNLELVLTAALSSQIDSIWVAQDLGRKGGRRTGLALTDEFHLPSTANRWSLTGIEKATRGPIVREASAGYVWEALNRAKRRVFLWNIVPFHTHPANQPLVNRSHTREEAEVGMPFLLSLLEVLRPRCIVAVGRMAEAALERHGINSNVVRHPGRGGGSKFLREIATLHR